MEEKKKNKHTHREKDPTEIASISPPSAIPQPLWIHPGRQQSSGGWHLLAPCQLQQVLSSPKVQLWWHQHLYFMYKVKPKKGLRNSRQEVQLSVHKQKHHWASWNKLHNCYLEANTSTLPTIKWNVFQSSILPITAIIMHSSFSICLSARPSIHPSIFWLVLDSYTWMSNRHKTCPPIRAWWQLGDTD